MFGARMRPTQTLVVGAAVAIAIWIGELVAGPTEARHFIADFGWTGFGLSAAFASGRALFAPIGRDRGGWAWIFMGAVAWAVGQLFWDLYDIVGLRAALSMFWGLPPQETRRAHLALLLGIASSTVAFAFWLPQYINESFAPGGPLDLFRMFGLFGVALAGRLNAAEGGPSAPLVPAS